MEKTLRVLGNEDGHAGHLHSHSHGDKSAADELVQTSGVSLTSSTNELRSRTSEKSEISTSTNPNGQEVIKVAHTSKLSAYLNLFGDFVHNM